MCVCVFFWRKSGFLCMRVLERDRERLSVCVCDLFFEHVNTFYMFMCMLDHFIASVFLL